MGKRNKHGTSNSNPQGGISEQYMQELGPWYACPKNKCSGTLTDIFVRYVRGGPIFNDKECTFCGKVVKDKRTYDYLKDINFQNRKAREEKKKSKGKGRPKRIETERKLLDKVAVLTNPWLQKALQYEPTCR